MALSNAGFGVYSPSWPGAFGWLQAIFEDIFMSKLNRLATPLIAVAIMSSVPFVSLAQNSQAGNDTKNNAVQEWNAPPPGTEQAQQGYRDGIEAAKLDTLAKRKIDAKSSHLYQHPPVKGDARDAYRSAFESGYQAALKHGASS
jgi:hypothetical protein